MDNIEANQATEARSGSLQRSVRHRWIHCLHAMPENGTQCEVMAGSGAIREAVWINEDGLAGWMICTGGGLRGGRPVKWRLMPNGQSSATAADGNGGAERNDEKI